MVKSSLGKRFPRSTTTCWVTRRKAQVIAAIRGGLLTVDQACQRYRLTVDELAVNGNPHSTNMARAGLKTTMVQQVRFLRGVDPQRR